MGNRATIRVIGLSVDGRTNRWKLTCVCGASTEPPTTRLAKNTIECRSCHLIYLVDYNKVLDQLEKNKSQSAHISTSGEVEE